MKIEFEAATDKENYYDILNRHTFTRKVILNLATEFMNTIKFEININNCDVHNRFVVVSS